jgi:hypothetical protein
MHEDGRAVRRRPLARLAVLVLVVTGLTAGCTEPADKADESPSPTTTPLSDIDLSGVVADRAPFCDGLDPASLEAVLGGEPERRESYEAGQRVELARGLRDVANEYSCLFSRGRRTARAWLFAQPVFPAQADAWVEERSRAEGCESTPGLSFGDPGVVQSCDAGTLRRVTAVGLFGDGWLSCQVLAPESVDPAELAGQTQRWCAEVAQATAS